MLKLNRFNTILLLMGLTAVPAVSQTSGPIAQMIQVEDCTDTSGVGWPAITFKSQESRVAFRECSNGDWIRFDDVSFLDGEYDSIVLYYWSGWPEDASGASVVFRLDSPTGTAIATVSNLSGTSGYGYTPSEPAGASISGVTGVHDVYMTFQGGSNICTVDKFCLKGTMTTTVDDAKTYYVDAVDGSDTGNDGLSAANAFQTIQKAASAMKPGSRCYIRRGIYRETVKPMYTGLAGAELTFEAYNGENVVISGADPISGWTQHDGNIYKAPMPVSIGKYQDQILVDGVMAWMARCPNVEEDYTPHPWLNWCGGAAGVQDMRPWKGRTDPLTIGTRVCFGDNGSFDRIDGNFPPFDMSVENNTATSSDEYQLPARLFGQPADFFAGGLISLNNYYWSTIGVITSSSSETADKTVINADAWNSVVTDVQGPGFISHVLELLDSPNEWYRDDNGDLHLWTPGSDDPSGHLVEAKRRVLGFDLRGKQYVTLKGLRFLATSATLADAHNCVLDDCHFKYVSHSDVYDWYETGAGYFGSPFDPTGGYAGVYISGSNNTFENGSVAVSARSGIILSGRDNTVTNSHIHDCNYTVSYQAGISVMKRYLQDNEDAFRLTISNNTLAFCGRGNVQIAWASSPETPADRTRIMYNDFGPAAFTTHETGSLAAQGSQFCEVAYNWFHGTAGMNSGDIVMEYDFGARHYIVHHNVFWQGETIVQGFKTGCHWIFDWNDDLAKCFNNTVVDSNDVGHRDWDMDWIGYKKNNIMGMSDTVSWHYTDAVNRDYTLRSTSPAIDAGDTITGWVETYNGAAPDMGAYEFGEPRWTAGADWEEQPWVYPPPESSVFGAFGPGRGPAALRPRVRVVPGKLLIEGIHQPARVALYNASGALVVQRSTRGESAVLLETSGFARGVYLLRVSNAGRSAVFRMLLR